MIIWWLFYLFARKWTTHPLSPGYVASKYRWPGLHAQKRWSRICCIHHCKVTPVLFDAGDDNHTNARLRTRNYSFCICNSGIARFAVFAIDSFDGALATSARTIYSREQDGSHCTVTTLGFTIVWQNLNSEHPNEQLAKTNIIKACIVNESDGLVHLDKIVPRRVWFENQ